MQDSTDELWQLYNEQGVPLSGQGASRHDVFGDALLHGAAHVWVWRETSKGVEILLQQRAGHKMTWPHRYDVSAAGHIDLGEDPLAAALRETSEELGLLLRDHDLWFMGVWRLRIAVTKNATENELQWVYLHKLIADRPFILERTEVSSLVWKPLADFKHDTTRPESRDMYVPHGELYFKSVAASVESQLTSETLS